MKEPGSIQYKGIHFLPEVVACYKSQKLPGDAANQERQTLFEAIRREHIRGISIQHTWLRNHPILNFGLAAVLALATLGRFNDWLAESRAFDLSIVSIVSFVVFLIIYLRDILRRGPVLMVQLEGSRHKLPFSGPLEIDRARELLAGASAMGYPVDLSSVDSLPLPG